MESTATVVVLRERGQAPQDRDDLTKLARAAHAAIGLTKEDVASDRRAGEGVKQMLSALLPLVEGVGEVRNRASAAHGAEAGPAWVPPRHAALAAGAAQLWCQFLLYTLRDPKPPGAASPRRRRTAPGRPDRPLRALPAFVTLRSPPPPTAAARQQAGGL